MATFLKKFISFGEQGLKLKSANVKTFKELFKEAKAVDYRKEVGTFQKWCVCGLPCPSSLPRTHNTELLGILARLSSAFQGCHWFGLNLFYTWCIFSLGAMVTEKGLEPGAGEEVCNPRDGVGAPRCLGGGGSGCGEPALL